MKCIECNYNKIINYGIVKNTCVINNRCNLTGCSLPSDDISNLRICYNCIDWIGGGDWGLSCRQNYYCCNSDGFTEACEKFRGKEGYNDSN